MKKKRLLSVQGGGIRGIIPACCCSKIEKVTGKKIREVFDFGGGTSTGSLIGAACAAGVPAEESLNVYLNRGKRIFSPTSWIERDGNLIAKGRQFDAAVLHQELQVALQLHGDPGCIGWKLNDSPWPLVITAGNQRGNALYFTQDRPTNAGKFGKYSLVDAAVASACATTFHDPWKVEGIGFCVDGGCVSLADPCYQVCVEAFKGYKCYGDIDPDFSILLNLGTGFYNPKEDPPPPGPLLSRVEWVTGSLVGSSKTIAAETVDRHWPGVMTMVNPELTADIGEADVEYIHNLLHIGREIADSVDWVKELEL